MPRSTENLNPGKSEFIKSNSKIEWSDYIRKTE